MGRSALLLLTLGVFATAQDVQAQDPVKLSPNLYKVLLENEQVRVLEYRVKPGDKEPMHSHPAGVVYVFTDGQAKATTPDGASQVVETKAGQVLWLEPVTHTWEYIGPGEGRILIVEMKKSVPAKPSSRP